MATMTTNSPGLGRVRWSDLVDINVEHYGVSASNSATVNTPLIQAAIDAAPAGSRLVFPGDYLVNGTGLTITNKVDFGMVGPGSLQLDTASSAAVILKLVGTCSNIRVLDLGFYGDGLSAADSFQYGFYNNSGQTISNVWVERCRFHDLNLGIGFNADTSGTYANAFAFANEIEDIRGGDGGQGYGIFYANVTSGVAADNVIKRCGRHSVYVAKGGVSGDKAGVIIRSNVVREHRPTGTANPRPAIYVTRGFGVTVEDNDIIDFNDGGIGVTHDTVTEHDAGDVVVRGNRLAGRLNGVACVIVGESSNPTTYSTRDVQVTDNRIDVDFSDGGVANEIVVYNGKRVTIARNVIISRNVTEVVYRPIAIGGYAPRGSRDLDQVTAADNRLNLSLGASADASAAILRIVRLESDVCGLANQTLNTGYAWTASGSGTAEYYLRTSGGANPLLPVPVEIYDDGTRVTKGGTLGALAAGTCGYGDNDTLGYPTIYARLSDGTDPDASVMTADMSSMVRVSRNELLDALPYSLADFIATRVNKALTVEDKFGNTEIAYTAGDTAPSVFGATLMFVSNSGATTITALRNAAPGQIIRMVFLDANTTIQNGGASIRLAGGVDFVSSAYSILTLQWVSDAARWTEISRAVT